MSRKDNGGIRCAVNKKELASDKKAVGGLREMWRQPPVGPDL